jgi:hypothetical protein
MYCTILSYIFYDGFLHPRVEQLKCATDRAGVRTEYPRMKSKKDLTFHHHHINLFPFKDAPFRKETTSQGVDI